MEIVLVMLFLAFNNTDIKFDDIELIWRKYTVVKAMSSSRGVEQIEKYEFGKTALNKTL